MAPKIVLTYFDFPGPAEPARMALAMGGEQWEDKRLTFEEFGALKPSESSDAIVRVLHPYESMVNYQ